MVQEIRELDPTTVERIAAGEVVERPASVVKELVENSLDADASRVRVAVEAGGKASIRVSDDGIGMDEQALRRAVEKHTTSKIRDIDDLEGGLATLGFRGEALHAVGAVSRMTVTSRPHGGDRGTELTVEGGDVEGVKPAGCPEGTTVEISDLFYNVPARRKYLSQDATEFDHVNGVVTAYALANPDVAVELEHDGRETFATIGTGDLKETVMDVYGREVARAMIELDESAVPEGPLESVSGLVSHPETNRASREYLSTYVNDRFVTADSVREAVVEAYDTQLASDRYPFAVLFVEIDPAQVDVNVHPRKMDVRFADADGVREQITAAVADALRREGLLRSTAPRGKSAPAQTEIEPGSGEGGPARQDGDASTENGGDSTTGRAGDDPNDAPSPDAGPTTDTGDSGPTDTHPAPGPEAERTPATPTDADSTTGDAVTSDRSAAASDTPVSGPADDRPDRSQSSSDDGSSPVGADSSVTATDQQRFGDADPTVREFEGLPSMRVLGQLHDTYVVAETDDGLVLIDQHAADERINYERLREQFLGETTTQVLAEPVEIELTARESALFEQFTAALSRLGFQAGRVDDRTIEVTTVPALVAEAGGPELVREVLTSFVDREGAPAETVEAVADELLADLACYPSVTANTSLTDGSVVSLLEALADCENPYACPHGRPVVIEIDATEIEARFERDYPGHG